MGQVVSMLGLAFAASVACAFGMFLLWKGRWSGEDYPICGQCGYDLRGELGPRPSSEHRCSECGQTLKKETTETAVNRFQRDRRNRLAMAIVVVSSFVLGFCATVTLLHL
jgi:hypothetical protein